MTFSHQQLSKISHTLSEPRFATYLRHCGNHENIALKLYQWNLEISSAFITPLQILEVGIRNAAEERLEYVHTKNWPLNTGFIQSLPTSKGAGYNPRKNLQDTARKQPTTGKVVAELKFVFWEKLFTKRHDGILWNNHIHNILPYAPVDLNSSQVRSRVHDDIFNIRNLRNRIAHHEPIFSRNLKEDYDRIRNLITWRDTTTSVWMHSFQQVERLISEKPIL